MEERDAVARLKRGDPGGLEGLVRRHQVRAMRAAYLVTRDLPLAEDIVQAAFLRAYERIGQFDAARPFGPWFLRSVVNDAVKAARRYERQVPLGDCEDRSGDQVSLADTLADQGAGPADLLEAAELRQAVWQALGQLPPSQRAVIVLRYYLELNESEMADALACPKGTVKWRLHAARGRLRTLLDSLRLVVTDAGHGSE